MKGTSVGYYRRRYIGLDAFSGGVFVSLDTVQRALEEG